MLGGVNPSNANPSNVNQSKISYPLTDQKTATMAAIQSLSEVAVKPIRPYRGVAVWCVVFFALVPDMCAQEATPPRHIGVPQDWSQHHIVFSRDALARHPDLIDREPRIRYQEMQRWQVPSFGVFHGADPLPASAKKTGLSRDWNVGMAGHIQADTFPAKYSFDPSAAPDCTNDYVVFGLNIAETPHGTGAGANLVAFHNLYVDPAGDGLCPVRTSGAGLTAPTPFFAYNITTVHGGSILTSPVLSEDGTKIAFVESIPANAGLGIAAQAIFHVLTWTAGQGTPLDSAAPTMTNVPLIPPSPLATADDTTSSPWVDYTTDTAYVGTDNGVLYQIVGVFKTGSTVSGSPWPITLTGNRLSSPVLDSNLGLLMVGGYINGTLYQVTTSGLNAGAVATLQVGYTGNGSLNPGIVAPPIVDVANGTTFVVSAYGTFIVTTPPSFTAILLEADTATLGAEVLEVADLGQGNTVGTPAPVLHLYEPAFSNDYYNDPTTGVISLCGTGVADTTPWQYVFGFGSGDVMNAATPVMSQSLNASASARCTGWTEFFNPNVPSGGSDFFFFGLTQDCNGTTGGAVDGCVVALSTNGSATGYTQAATSVTIDNGPSGIIVDNYSTAAQASSIYFTSAVHDAAYKYTQNGLN